MVYQYANGTKEGEQTFRSDPNLKMVWVDEEGIVTGRSFIVTTSAGFKLPKIKKLNKPLKDTAMLTKTTHKCLLTKFIYVLKNEI